MRVDGPLTECLLSLKQMNQFFSTVIITSFSLDSAMLVITRLAGNSCRATLL